ncbi:hypothetical protein AGMMS50284_4810 [Clostridia bacterium]|nr:hypothetical protein AGMMS50284_4810 [Clostridia bacterium]
MKKIIILISSLFLISIVLFYLYNNYETYKHFEEFATISKEPELMKKQFFENSKVYDDIVKNIKNISFENLSDVFWFNFENSCLEYYSDSMEIKQIKNYSLKNAFMEYKNKASIIGDEISINIMEKNATITFNYSFDYHPNIPGSFTIRIIYCENKKLLLEQNSALEYISLKENWYYTEIPSI